MVLTVDTAFERELRKLVDEEVENQKEAIALGQLISYEDYRFHSGKLAGMRQVLGYFDEVNKKLAER